MTESLHSESGVDRQNIMRLRINRIALVQELRADHIINHLLQTGLISEYDRERVDRGTTPADKARRLVDIVTTKTHVPDWYNIFRQSILSPEDANAETRKRYRSLVEFLDNTVIHRPMSQSSKFSSSTASLKLPHYEPLPEISKQEQERSMGRNIPGKKRSEEEEVMTEKGARDNAPEREDKVSVSHDKPQTMTLVKGFFQQWVTTPDNFRSLLQVPEELFRELETSQDKYDKAQLEQEKLVLEKIRKLEIVAVLSRRKQLPEGFELCMCEAVHDVLFDTKNHHMYFKYLRMLERSDVDLLIDIVQSFGSVLEGMDFTRVGSDTTQSAIKLGFTLMDFLGKYGYFQQAEVIMTILLAVLNLSHNVDSWMTKYKGFVNLMHFRNMNYDFKKVQNAYGLVSEMEWQISMMSFGQDIIDKTPFYVEMSTLMLEYGSANSAYGWAQKAIKSMNQECPADAVNALCAGVMAYSARWSIKRAETLAIQAVQQARHHFGTNHPLYIKALLHYCHFSSEFKQDKNGVQIAKYTLRTAQKTYGCEMIDVALAHRAVSKALLVVQDFEDMAYFHHASEALRIARAQLPDQYHGMMAMFLHSSASALQWKALHSSKESQEATLKQAEVEAKQALMVISSTYGELSLRTAQICLLLGQIYSKMDQTEQAEEMLKRSVLYMKLCQPENSHFLMLANATMGTFFKVMDKPREAIHFLQNVVKVPDCGVYLKWVHVVYDTLIATLQSLNRNKESDHYQIQLSKWLRDNPKHDTMVTLQQLQQDPPTIDNFKDEFNVWEKKGKAILSVLKKAKD